MLALLVRHGQTDANRERAFLGRRDPPLNETGRAEAAALGRAIAAGLDGRPVAAVRASDQRRAWETAEIIAQTIGGGETELPVTPEPALREMDIGDLDGLAVDEGIARYPEFFARWRQRAGGCRMPGGETLREVRERAWRVLEADAAAHPDEACVFVTHTFVLLSLLCKVLGLPLDRFRGLHVSTGTLSVVRLGGERPRLISVNVRPEVGWSEGYFR